MEIIGWWCQELSAAPWSWPSQWVFGNDTMIDTQYQAKKRKGASCACWPQIDTDTINSRLPCVSWTMFTGKHFQRQRLRLHVSRYPDIWISGCQRSGYLGSVYTCRIETFSAFTRLQISGCIIRGILAMCRRNTQMLFLLVKLHAFTLSSNVSFLFIDVCWLNDKVKVLFGKFSYRL